MRSYIIPKLMEIKEGKLRPFDFYQELEDYLIKKFNLVSKPFEGTKKVNYQGDEIEVKYFNKHAFDVVAPLDKNLGRVRYIDCDVESEYTEDPPADERKLMIEFLELLEEYKNMPEPEKELPVLQQDKYTKGNFYQ